MSQRKTTAQRQLCKIQLKNPLPLSGICSFSSTGIQLLLAYATMRPLIILERPLQLFGEFPISVYSRFCAAAGIPYSLYDCRFYQCCCEVVNGFVLSSAVLRSILHFPSSLSTIHTMYAL